MGESPPLFEPEIHESLELVGEDHLGLHQLRTTIHHVQPMVDAAVQPELSPGLALLGLGPHDEVTEPLTTGVMQTPSDGRLVHTKGPAIQLLAGLGRQPSPVVDGLPVLSTEEVPERPLLGLARSTLKQPLETLRLLTKPTQQLLVLRRVLSKETTTLVPDTGTREVETIHAPRDGTDVSIVTPALQLGELRTVLEPSDVQPLVEAVAQALTLAVVVPIIQGTMALPGEFLPVDLHSQVTVGSGATRDIDGLTAIDEQLDFLVHEPLENLGLDQLLDRALRTPKELLLTQMPLHDPPLSLLTKVEQTPGSKHKLSPCLEPTELLDQLSVRRTNRVVLRDPQDLLMSLDLERQGHRLGLLLHDVAIHSIILTNTNSQHFEMGSWQHPMV